MRAYTFILRHQLPLCALPLDFRRLPWKDRRGMALVPWKDDPLGTLEAAKLFLYGFGVLQTPPPDELRIKDRRMPALTLTQFRNARKILGVRLEPANK